MILYALALLFMTGYITPPSLVTSYQQTAPSVVDIGCYEVYVPTVRDIIEKMTAHMMHKPYKEPRKFKVRSGGSGLIVRADGVILTAAHVVRETSIVRIELYNGLCYKAIVLARDPQVDLALLRIIPQVQEPLRPVRLGRERPMGWPVYAIGNPQWFRWAITSGVLTTVDEEQYVSDALVEHGSSGGGLFDATNNTIIGVTVQLFKTYSASVRIRNIKKFLDSRMEIADFVLQDKLSI